MKIEISDDFVKWFKHYNPGRITDVEIEIENAVNEILRIRMAAIENNYTPIFKFQDTKMLDVLLSKL